MPGPGEGKKAGETRRPLSVEQELDAARAAIRRTAQLHGVAAGRAGNGNVSSTNSWFNARLEHALLATVYCNLAAFHR